MVAYSNIHMRKILNETQSFEKVLKARFEGKKFVPWLAPVLKNSSEHTCCSQHSIVFYMLVVAFNTIHLIKIYYEMQSLEKFWRPDMKGKKFVTLTDPSSEKFQ